MEPQQHGQYLSQVPKNKLILQSKTPYDNFRHIRRSWDCTHSHSLTPTDC